MNNTDNINRINTACELYKRLTAEQKAEVKAELKRLLTVHDGTEPLTKARENA